MEQRKQSFRLFDLTCGWTSTLNSWRQNEWIAAKCFEAQRRGLALEVKKAGRIARQPKLPAPPRRLMH